jgi:hypothetical protein
MPVPSKRKNEDKQAYLSRCMSDETMKKEFKSNQQRVAVCLSKACEDLDMVAQADFLKYVEEYGYEEELTEDNFYIPTIAEYEDFGEDTEEWDVAAAKPGLWENIRKKKERMGKKYKPAKPGDPDRPDKDAWKKAQSDSGSEMALEQIQKMHDQLMEIVAKLKIMSMEIEFQDWTKDMISKAEIYVQNVYDFVKYYEPGKYEDEYVEKEDEEEEMKIEGSEYQGRKVTLNKPFRTPKGPKKFSVYVKNEKGNVVKVNFGDPNMKIKKDIPERRKSFRARHNCDNPGPKWKARYWSCKAW